MKIRSGEWCPPITATSTRLIDRGHDVTCLGDRALVNQVAGSRITIEPAPDGLDLPHHLRDWDEAGDAPLPLGQWTQAVLPWAPERAEIELMLRRRADFAAIAPPDLTLIATDARFDRPPNPPPPECTGSSVTAGGHAMVITTAPVSAAPPTSVMQPD